jgi:heat-inducible transcriptional repressor
LLPPPDRTPAHDAPPELSARQGAVLAALVTAYVPEGQPVGSSALASRLPLRLSPASVRNTLAELAGLGLVEKPHHSAGRLPTERGLRLYVDRLLAPAELGARGRGRLAGSLHAAEPDGVVRLASRLLSERTRQLGFVLPPRLDRLVLRHVSFVRVSSERVLTILVSSDGTSYRRVLRDPGIGDQAELERLGTALRERVFGRTLGEARNRLRSEARALRSRADRAFARTVRFVLEALESAGDEDVVIATRLALLDQPEFRDPARLRGLFEALEAREKLIQILDEVLDERGVTVAFGSEVGEPALAECALVTAPYGDAEAPLGALGVIGPTRMDYARVIPLVRCLSQLVTESLNG